MSPADLDRTEWFTDARFGLSITWGLHAIPARGESVRWKEHLPAEVYRQYFDEFNPSRYSAKRWAELARKAGMRYAVATAKHHDGFCLFESDYTDFHALHTPARRDFMLDFVDAFRDQDLKVGFYYSLLDWNNPDSAPHEGDFTRFVAYVHDQIIRDLMSRYGRIDVLWFDSSSDDRSGEAWLASELLNEVRALQPQIMINNRLSAGYRDPTACPGLGDFSTPEGVVPAAYVHDAQGRPCIWEARVPLTNHLGYVRDDRSCKKASQVVRLLVECVSKGGNLLLNVAPNATGEIPPDEESVLLQVGAWLSRYGESIYGCGQAHLPEPDWGWLTRGDDCIYAHICDHRAGPIVVPRLGGMVQRARLLADGSEVGIAKSHGDDLELSLDRLPDPIDTVVALELAPVAAANFSGMDADNAQISDMPEHAV
jgi:alpha-L-fucosidase